MFAANGNLINQREEEPRVLVFFFTCTISNNQNPQSEIPLIGQRLRRSFGDGAARLQTALMEKCIIHEEQCVCCRPVCSADFCLDQKETKHECN